MIWICLRFGGMLLLSQLKRNKTKKKGGGMLWSCNFCQLTRNCSYTRLRAHLLKLKGKGITVCPTVTPQNIREMETLEKEAMARSLQNKPLNLQLPVPSSSIDTSYEQENASRKRRAIGSESDSTNPIQALFNVQQRNQLDAEIARLFYANGLPFNLARSLHYVNSYNFAASHNLSGYKPPGYNALRTTLLQQEKSWVETQLLPIKTTWPAKGVSIVSDGWSDSQRRPLINMLAVSESGPMFLRAVDCSGETKGKEFIFDLLRQVVEEVGKDNVVQVITDNASNCKGAGELIEALYPTIFWTPCVVHTLNLALQNICNPKNIAGNEDTYNECCWIIKYADDALMIKNFIMNHSKRLHIYNTFASLKLFSIATTRFASVIVMLRRFKLIKTCLRQVVWSDQWDVYRLEDSERDQVVKEIVSNDLWWDKVDYILAFTAPIYDMIRFIDTDKPSLHLVYEMWDTMIEGVKHAIYRQLKISHDMPSTFYDAVFGILIFRWNKANTPLHCLAHSLNPRYYSADWLTKDTTRQAPHQDVEVSNERKKCFQRYFPNPSERLNVISEFAKFSSMTGDFLNSDAIAHRSQLDPKSWWVSYGASTPVLQSLALKLLGQPSSSSAAERNWSTYSFIHSLRRNRLTPQRAQDLVFVHTNLRLLGRKQPEYLTGITKMWDVGGDYEELELATLSLDEPELEKMIFTDDIVVEDDDFDED